jgi:hypothetical protein
MNLQDIAFDMSSTALVVRADSIGPKTVRLRFTGSSSWVTPQI